MLPLTIGLDHRLVDRYQTATMTRIFHESSTMIPPPSTRCLSHPATPEAAHLRAVRREEASDRTGRKAEFVERDHATEVTAPQDIDRVRRLPVRGAAAINPVPNPDPGRHGSVRNGVEPKSRGRSGPRRDPGACPERGWR